MKIWVGPRKNIITAFFFLGHVTKHKTQNIKT